MKRALLFICLLPSISTAVVPRPDHVLICVLENHGYGQIISSPSAPFINQLSGNSAMLDSFFALTHPSQPNYIMFFSGSNQGVTTDNTPGGTPWSSQNLGSSLLQAGFTFGAYSEDLPSVGSTASTSGAYARKHCPWVNWQGTGSNGIPGSVHQPFSAFPTDYNLLPNLCYVIPNMDDNMHNGNDPARIVAGDSWVNNNLSSYITWAQTHNSLFILTFDEDDNYNNNRIVTLFSGPMVVTGNYSDINYDHYSMLRTLEEMFGLPYAGNSATAVPIEEIWGASAGVTPNVFTNKVLVFPNPAAAGTKVEFQIPEEVSQRPCNLKITTADGRLISSDVIETGESEQKSIFIKPLEAGVYFYQLETPDEFSVYDGEFLVF